MNKEEFKRLIERAYDKYPAITLTIFSGNTTYASAGNIKTKEKFKDLEGIFKYHLDNKFKDEKYQILAKMEQFGLLQDHLYEK
jgi:hypothetical protein